jgi:hypothetical protein
MASELRLRLDANLRDDRIAGRLYDEHGDEHRFSGWLALLTLLEYARRGAAAPPEPPRVTIRARRS